MSAHEASAERAAAEPSDASVIAQVLAGNRARFAVLVQRYNQRAFRACRAVLRNDADAEDALQTAWLKAFRALASFRADSSFRTWMTRIAINEATTRLRQQRKLAAAPLEEITMTESENPEREVFTKELARLLEHELDELPEGLRSVVVLRDVIELDTAETAECLQIAEENVRVRLHRARTALAGRLTGSALPEVWRFDGERCARVLAHVMARIEAA
jgi:RNA polymerase sigma-70 factor (ECF subfamily)